MKEQTSLPALKAVLIIGQNIPTDPKLLELYANNPEYMVIGDGRKEISVGEIEDKLRGRIGTGTRIDIHAHGLVDEFYYYVDGSGFDKKFGRLLEALQAAAGQDVPLQIHSWTCFSGRAAGFVELLPIGSFVVGHGPNNDVIFGKTLPLATAEIIRALQSTAPRDSIRIDMGAELKNFLLSTSQQASFAIRLTNGEMFKIDITPEMIFSILTTSEPLPVVLNEFLHNGFLQLQKLREQGLLPDSIQIPDKFEPIEFTQEQLKTYMQGLNFYLGATNNSELSATLKLPDAQMSKDKKLMLVGVDTLVGSALMKHKELVQMLLELGVDPTKKSIVNGLTAVSAATLRGTEVLELILQSRGSWKEEELDAKTPDGKTALLLATTARPPQWSVCAMLLRAGANPNAQDEHGNTILHYLADPDVKFDRDPQALAALNALVASDNLDLSIKNNRDESGLQSAVYFKKDKILLALYSAKKLPEEYKATGEELYRRSTNIAQKGGLQ